MNRETAIKIYDEVLIPVCEASDCPADRDHFIIIQTDERECPEFRFCGSLGFGGKFWVNDGRFYVNCYREDETPKRRKVIEKANEKLALIHAIHKE